MKKLIEVVSNPSGLDSLNNYVGALPEEKLLVVLTRSRDSDVLTESNWECAVEKLGGESDEVEIHRFGHWACGWWEALCVVEGTKAHEIATQIESDLNHYPVLDDSDFLEREMNEANEVWKNCFNEIDRIAYIRRFRNQFEFHDFADLRAVVRGEYFNGYASELLS